MRSMNHKLMKLTLCLAMLAAFGLPMLAQELGKEGCDLEKIEKRLWCKTEGFVADKDLNDKGECKKCGKKPESVDTCVATYYVCKNCNHPTKDKGKCPGCGQENTHKEKQSLARICYVCSKCKHKQYEAGACPNGACEGNTLKKTCDESGKFPHTHTDKK